MARGTPVLQITHASGLHSVARKLAALHAEALRQNSEDSRGVSLSVLNLVAVAMTVENADIASQTVGHLAENHPARAIIVVVRPNDPERIEADVSLQNADTGRGRISAEQVRLTVGGEPAYHLASVVTPLLIPDIPVYLWLVGDPPLRQAFGQDAIAICERLLMDSGAYEDPMSTLITLAAEVRRTRGALTLSDIAWARSRGWRDLLVQGFDGPEMRPMLRGIESIAIECAGDTVSAQAWLLAGWMASRLGWQQVQHDHEPKPDVEWSLRPAGELDEGTLLSVRIRCRSGEHGASVTLERTGNAITTSIDIDGGLTARRAVPQPDDDIVHLVGALIEELPDDAVYAAALQRAARMAEHRRGRVRTAR